MAELDMKDFKESLENLIAVLEPKGKEALGDTVKQLIKEVEENSEELTAGPKIEITDLSKQSTEFLTAKAHKDIQYVKKALTYREDGRAYQCIYLSRVVREDHVMEGLKSICEDLNNLSAACMINSALAPPSHMKLAISPLTKPMAVFAFVHVPKDSVDLAKKLVHNWQEKEGEMPEPSENLEPDLPEGEFMAVERISHSMSSYDPKTADAQVHERINQYLAILPKGTELVSVERCAITDLSVPYAIKFRNPVMREYKEVKVDWVRSFTTIGDHLEQFNLFLGLTYVKRNGKTVGLSNLLDGKGVFPYEGGEVKNEKEEG